MDDYGHGEQTEAYESGSGYDWGGEAGYPATGDQAWAGDGYATGDDQQAYAMYDQQAGGDGGLEDDDGEWSFKATLVADETSDA